MALTFVDLSAEYGWDADRVRMATVLAKEKMVEARHSWVGVDSMNIEESGDFDISKQKIFEERGGNQSDRVPVGIYRPTH